jgi:hypothetical protein
MKGNHRRALVAELRAGLAGYRDTSQAVATGFRIFAPTMKKQHVHHFTK